MIKHQEVNNGREYLKKGSRTLLALLEPNDYVMKIVAKSTTNTKTAKELVP